MIFFGILQIVLGLFALLGAAMIVLGIVAGRNMTPAQAPALRLMVPSVAMYIGAAVWFFTMGVGSIRVRRWARALTLVQSWMWLLMGLLTALTFAVFADLIFKSLPSEQKEYQAVIVGCIGIFLVVGFVLLPLFFVLFYRSPHVRATVERLDPTRRWTDRVPLSVLGFALWMGVSSAGLLLCSFMYRALPLGDFMLRGAAAQGALVVVAFICLFIIVQAMRLRRSGWWAALILMIVGAVYSLIFFPRIDFEKWYAAMELPSTPGTTEMITEMYTSPFFLGYMIVVWAIYLGFLLYIRRYFSGSEQVIT